MNLLGRVQVWMPLPETLCECCVCECVSVCVGPMWVLFRKRPWVFVCVCVCVVYVCCPDHVCEYVRAVPIVNGSAIELV